MEPREGCPVRARAAAARSRDGTPMVAAAGGGMCARSRVAATRARYVAREVLVGVVLSGRERARHAQSVQMMSAGRWYFPLMILPPA
eukprot:2487368-Prymnesium_polylepis.1